MIPQRQIIRNMIETGEWYHLHPVEAASRLAEVGRLQQNIVINASARRLKFIKQRMKSANLNIQDPLVVSAWMNKNPHLAAAAGWKNNWRDTLDMQKLYNELIDPEKAVQNATKELNDVFLTNITPEMLQQGTRRNIL